MQRKHINYLLVIIYGIANINIEAQAIDYPVIETFSNSISSEFNDLSRKDDYWKNTNLKRQYKQESDSTWMRFDYYENGNLKRKAVVKEYDAIDTIAIMNSEGKVEIDFRKNVIESFFGDYTEYYNDNSNEKIKCNGEIYYGVKSGNWIVYKNNTKEEFTLDEKGWPLGLYETCFFNNRTNRYQILVKGNYGKIKVKQKGFDYSNYKEIDIMVDKTVKTGIWYYYSRDGVLLNTISYN